MARELDTAFANQVVGKLELLLATILDFDEGLKPSIRSILNGSKSRIETFFNLNQLLPKEKQWEICPLSDITDKFILFTENALVDLLKKNESISDDMASNWTDDAANNKDRIIEELFGGSFGRKYSLLTDEDAADASNVILSNTFRTNGQDISVLAIIKAKTKPRSKTSSSTTSALANAEASRRKSNSKNSYLEASQFFKSMCTRDVNAMDSAKIVGIDLGVRYVVGACAKDGTAVRNLAVKSKALSEPSRRLEEWVRKQKTDALYSLERSLERADDDTESTFAKRWYSTYCELAPVYNSRKYKKMRSDAKKAQMGEKDRLTNAILNMVDGSIGWKAPENTFIGVGVASFDNTGGASFEDHFARRAQSLGYKLFGVNEYLTSQMCPHCHQKCEQFGMRVKYCRTCHKYYHRDVMAGENIADELRCELKGGGRLEYLQKKKGRKKARI
jgi:hypothetical protein